MKILVAPLNWGLGHASRCIPLVQRFMDEGHEVILGGDGDSLILLRKHFPKLRYVYLAPLNLRYSRGKSQVFAISKSIPALIRWSFRDHVMLEAILREESIDRVVSDNRFGLYSPRTECIYMTHQLHILLPKGWHWAEKMVARVHARIYAHFNKVWVPDFPGDGKSIPPRDTLAGELSHPSFRIKHLQCPIEYIGPLSRFERPVQSVPQSADTQEKEYGIVSVLSGPEPQRSMLEAEIKQRFSGQEQKVLIVQGLMSRPMVRIKQRNITIIPHLNDAELQKALLNADRIIARSGYSTIMDLHALGILGKAELIPTPGQPEQEYLATWLNAHA
ncbi:MAG: hypothetical protein IJ204_06920 [Paludibacteraceae bacterium]|nr:hypothetical protein [Paludibacteraceae bacterium]